MYEDMGDMTSVAVRVWRNPAVARPNPEGTIVHEETFSETLRVTPEGVTFGRGLYVAEEVMRLACKDTRSR